MNVLHREHAPITEAGWAEIDQEASRTLTHFLSARRLVDFEGPIGWESAAVPTGRLDHLDEILDGVSASARTVQPLIELRVPFEVSRRELEAIERGAADADFAPVAEAAQKIARAEDRLVFAGHSAGVIDGVVSASPHSPIAISDDYAEYPTLVARAVAVLRDAGVSGPYGLALGPQCHTGVIETTERGGYPILEHLKLILGGPLVWAPEVDGAVVVSLRGGDFQIVSGQDLSVGYADHDSENVQLFFTELLTFRNLEPAAAVPLKYS